MARINDKNLVPQNKRTKEEQREIAKQGGVKSGEVRRERKAMKDLLNDLLNMPIKPGLVEEVQNMAEIKGKNITVNEAILLVQIQRALHGDTQSAIFVRDTAGQKPKEDKVEIHDIVIKVAIEQDQDQGEYELIEDPNDNRFEN